MSTPLLATKLFVPPPRYKTVLRPCLIERLNDGLAAGRKLTLVSAPPGFGKTTLVSEWVAGCGRPIAWLSLDDGDNDSTRFLSYLVTAVQTLALSQGEGIAPTVGAGMLAALQSSQPPSIESILTTLLNEIAAISGNFVLVLDDYHAIVSKSVDQILTFLIEHLPPQMHLVIATREDPSLPLARLRARGQLTELRAADLRFTSSEAADFLNQVMELNLSAEEITALETRTEGWIAGLQLAAISMRGHPDPASFIQSFTGSHHFVLDYLVEEVLAQQPETVQTFLLRTSILDRMCGSLCAAVLFEATASGQKTLEYLEHANLFIVPLDDERRWYRYHHLFAELLRQRLQQSDNVADYHIRASQWYENNDLMLEAFHHAAAANDIERAVRLMESNAMPLHLPGAATVILKWLESLPTAVLNAQPALWWKQAALLLIIGQGQITGVEEKLQATEAALAATTLPGAEPDDETRNLIGKIAVARSLLAQTQHQAETSLVQARRALEYLHPSNLPYRSTATQSLGFAYYLQGDRMEAGRAYTEALSLAHAAGDVSDAFMATTRLGQIQESGNQLYVAAETYQRALQLIGDYPPPNSPVAYLGLARIHYEWNDLDVAEQYGEKSLRLARQYDQVIDRLILSELFLARLKLTRGDAVGAADILSQAEQTARQKNFTQRLADIVAAQAFILLRQSNIVAAVQLTHRYDLPLMLGQYDLPLMRARVLLAQGDPSAALAVLEPLHQQAEAKGWADERLKAMVLQMVALRAHGEKDKAVRLLGEALALAEPGGFIRLFVDEGLPMARLLSEAATRGISPDYIGRLQAVFDAEKRKNEDKPDLPPPSPAQPLIEPLSQRELEILKLIAQGLSNREIGGRLFLALDTVKGHNRRIFDKLQVQSRTEAVARARELSLL